MPRFRFTIRRMMVAVAIVGVIVGLWQRSAEFHRRAVALAFPSWPQRLVPDRLPFIVTPEMIRAQEEKRRRLERWETWRISMSAKYQRASRYPWLPVAPDS
jgi:hypothetical protein